MEFSYSSLHVYSYSILYPVYPQFMLIILVLLLLFSSFQHQNQHKIHPSLKFFFLFIQYVIMYPILLIFCFSYVIYYYLHHHWIHLLHLHPPLLLSIYLSHPSFITTSFLLFLISTSLS